MERERETSLPLVCFAVELKALDEDAIKMRAQCMDTGKALQPTASGAGDFERKSMRLRVSSVSV